MMYTVRSGDYLSKIAAEHGFADWRVIYNDSHNAEFRRKRPNPNLIYPGDQLFIPDKAGKTAPAPTGGQSKFRAHRAGNTLQVALIDFEGNPLADKSGTLIVDGDPRPVTTDGSGVLHTTIPAQLTHAHLTIEGVTMVLALGQLNPMDDADDDGISGVQGRLTNLGFYDGPIDGVLGDDTADAIRAFQRNNDMTESGGVDQPLKDKLREKYGS